MITNKFIIQQPNGGEKLAVVTLKRQKGSPKGDYDISGPSKTVTEELKTLISEPLDPAQPATPIKGPAPEDIRWLSTFMDRFAHQTDLWELDFEGPPLQSDNNPPDGAVY